MSDKKRKQPEEIPEKKNPSVLPFYQIHGEMSEKPISPVYPEIDTDLARDNIENDIPDADLQDL